MSRRPLEKLAESICNSDSGLGADGLLVLSPSKESDGMIDIYNSDGSWAERSGNGLRIACFHCHRKAPRKTSFLFETATSRDQTRIVKKTKSGCLVETELGEPSFETSRVPVKSDERFMINRPLKLGRENFPVTCLSIGNPHTVLFVESLEFDWQTIGADIEKHELFPNRTNVEFAKIVTRSKIIVADWERGVGVTGSSGTGAAAAVAARVMNGQLSRECEVVFETGSIFVNWRQDTSLIEITGPVEFITEGVYEFR